MCLWTYENCHCPFHIDLEAWNILWHAATYHACSAVTVQSHQTFQ